MWAVWFQQRVNGVLSAETQWGWKVCVVCFQLRYSEGERCEWCAFSWDTVRVKGVSGVLSAEIQWGWKVWVVCFQLRHSEGERCEWCAFSWDTVRVKGVSGVLSAETQWGWKVLVVCFQLECCGVQAEFRGRTGIQNLELSRQDSWLLFRRTRWYQNARQQSELFVLHNAWEMWCEKLSLVMCFVCPSVHFVSQESFDWS